MRLLKIYGFNVLSAVHFSLSHLCVCPRVHFEVNREETQQLYWIRPKFFSDEDLCNSVDSWRKPVSPLVPLLHLGTMLSLSTSKPHFIHNSLRQGSPTLSGSGTQWYKVTTRPPAKWHVVKLFRKMNIIWMHTSTWNRSRTRLFSASLEVAKSTHLGIIWSLLMSGRRSWQRRGKQGYLILCETSFGLALESCDSWARTRCVGMLLEVILAILCFHLKGL